MFSQQPPYHTIEELIGLIDEPNRSSCFRMLADNRALFDTAPGSSSNHQAWKGGYLDHLREVMNIAVALYSVMNQLRPLPFLLSDVLLVLWLHDLEKPWKYVVNEDGFVDYKPEFHQKSDQQAFRMKLIAKYEIVLTEAHVNGLEYAEGEIKNHSANHRYMGPLAAFVHACDVLSARMWHAFPKHDGSDPWAI